MSVLVLAEHNNYQLAASTSRALTAARAMGERVDILVAGHRCRAVAEEASKLDGIGRVLCADTEILAHRLPEPTSALLVSQMDNYDALVAPATAMGKSVLPRVAALLDVMQISEIIEVLAKNTFKRTIYAGNAVQTVRSDDAKKVVTIRFSAFAAGGNSNSAPIETLPADTAAQKSRFVSETLTKAERPELASAKIIISGGRAFGSKEKFDALLGPLADKLGAAIGASRAAVDAGYAPNDLQVGQTGHIAAPDLYIACGISGAIQHIAGMKQSRLIVAINSDPDAPIFQYSDYGLVGDLFEILPELTDTI